MYVDALGLVSASQAFGAAAVSAQSVDLGVSSPQRQIGTGEPVGFGVCVTTGGTVANTLVEVISATDGALTTGIVVHGAATLPVAAGGSAAGKSVFIPIAPGATTGRYLGIRATTAGGTISLTAWLTAASLFSVQQQNYAKGYTIS
jgi:hypothetical protein